MEENKKAASAAGQAVNENIVTDTAKKSRSGCALWSVTGVVALLALAGALYYAYTPAEAEKKEPVVEKKVEKTTETPAVETKVEQQAATAEKVEAVSAEASKETENVQSTTAAPKTVAVPVDMLKDLQNQIADLKKQVAEKQAVPVNQGGTTIIVNAQRTDSASGVKGNAYSTYGYQKDGSYRAKSPAEMLLSSQRLMDTMPATSDYSFSQNANGTVENLTVRSNRAVTDITTVNGKVVQRQGQVSGFYDSAEATNVRKAVILPTTVSTKEMDVSKTNVRVYGD